jgi:hypothetical protein
MIGSRVAGESFRREAFLFCFTSWSPVIVLGSASVGKGNLEPRDVGVRHWRERGVCQRHPPRRRCSA